MPVRAEERYAARVQQAGYYLGYADIELLARARGQSLHVVCLDDSEELKLQRFSETAKETCGELFPSRSDEGACTTVASWVVVLCNVSLQRVAAGQSLNHFMPAWYQGQFTEEGWELIRLSALQSVADQKAANYKAMVEAMGDADGATTDDLQVEELVLESKRLELHEQAVHALLKVGVVFKRVPADGDCALWSVLRLEMEPPFDAEDFLLQAAPGSHEEMVALREDAWLFEAFCDLS